MAQIFHPQNVKKAANAAGHIVGDVVGFVGRQARKAADTTTSFASQAYQWWYSPPPQPQEVVAEDQQKDDLKEAEAEPKTNPHVRTDHAQQQLQRRNSTEQQVVNPPS